MHAFILCDMIFYDKQLYIDKIVLKERYMDSNELDAIAKEVHMSYYSKGKFGKDREEIKEIC